MGNAESEEVQAKLLSWFSGIHIEIPSAQTDLFDSGVIDSQRLVELLLHIEQTFDIKFDVGDFEIETFRSIQRIAALIVHRRHETRDPQLSKVF